MALDTSSLIYSLYALRKGHDQAIVEYVDFCYPGLEEQISNLSGFLRGIVASDIQPNDS